MKKLLLVILLGFVWGNISILSANTTTTTETQEEEVVINNLYDLYKNDGTYITPSIGDVNGIVVPVYIEMKRQKGGTVSDSQFKWIKALRIACQYVAVCEGGGEAVEFLEAVEKKDNKKIDEYEEKFDKMFENWEKKQKKQKNDCPF